MSAPLIERPRVSNKNIFITGGVLLLCILLFEFSSLDIWIQNHFFNFERHQWIVDRDDRLLKVLFYDGVKQVFIVGLVLLIFTLIFFRNRPWIQRRQPGLWIVCASMMSVPLAVGTLKATTKMPCPRDLAVYGGTHPPVKLFGTYPAEFKPLEREKCYPAGHASGGFALLSLIYLAKRRRQKILVVVSVLLLSWAIGGYKMLIGDHFLGHTMITMVLAWLIVQLNAGVVSGWSDQ